jgi:hypothetical protein
VLVGSFHEDLGEDTGSWTHVNSTLTRKVVHGPTPIISTLTNFPPTLIIGPFSIQHTMWGHGGIWISHK